MIRYEGPPADPAGRLEKELRCYRLLEALGIRYQRIDHAPTMTMELCAEIDRILEAPTCKNLLLCNRQMTDFYLLLIPGEKNFRTSALSRQIGSSRLSFAPGEYMEQFLDITPGSLSILGLMNDTGHRVQLLIDEDVRKEEYIGMHPCINTTSLRITTRDLQNILIPALGHPPRYVTLE